MTPALRSARKQELAWFLISSGREVEMLDVLRQAAATLTTAAAVAGLLAGSPSAVTAQAVTYPAIAAPQPASKWVVDLVHSQIDFRVRHILGRVRGTFTRWYAVLLSTDPNLPQGTVQVSAETASLSTGNSYRDADLRSGRFFAVDSFPRLTFDGTGIVATDSTVNLHGILTIKGISRPVTLTGQYRGVATDGEGHDRIAFDASTTVDRRDFGLTYNELVGGRQLIGDDVEITIAIEALRVR
jgi:polyisoprenoid-binding protein YceI